MARQSLSPRNVAKLRAKTGLDFVGVLVRGGTDHRKDLLMRDGTVTYLYSDGTTEQAGIRHEHPVTPHRN